MGKTYFVYFMSNKSRRLYVGITSQLPLRARTCSGLEPILFT